MTRTARRAPRLVARLPLLVLPLLVLPLALLPAGCCREGSDGGGPVVPPVPRLFALLTTGDMLFPPFDSAVEIVDLGTWTRVGGFALSGSYGSSLAVAPDGTRLYIADRPNGKILVRDPAGAVLGEINLPGVYDLVLDAAGARLWAASFTGPTIARFDALTLAPGPSITPAGLSGGLALSPDGTWLAWPSAASSGGVNGCYIADASTLAAPAAVPLTGASCLMQPNNVHFATSNRLVVWDSNCDVLSQVDVPTLARLPLGEVALANDSGASVNFNNCLVSSAATSQVYGFKESQQVFSVAPFGPSFTLHGGFSGVPFLPVLSADEATLLVAVLHFSPAGPATLDAMATATEVFTPGVYTFTSPLRFVIDGTVRNVAP